MFGTEGMEFSSPEQASDQLLRAQGTGDTSRKYTPGKMGAKNNGILFMIVTGCNIIAMAIIAVRSS